MIRSSLFLAFALLLAPPALAKPAKAAKATAAGVTAKPRKPAQSEPPTEQVKVFKGFLACAEAADESRLNACLAATLTQSSLSERKQVFARWLAYRLPVTEVRACRENELKDSEFFELKTADALCFEWSGAKGSVGRAFFKNEKNGVRLHSLF